jgi:hypothetical protein
MMAWSSMPPPAPVAEEIIPDILVRCACGRMVWLGKKRNTGQPIGLHELPTCQLFLENEDLVDYVHALRRHLAAKHGN